MRTCKFNYGGSLKFPPIYFLLTIVFLFFLQETQGQTQDSTLLRVAREVMTNAKYCALITLDDTGRPRVRTMDPFLPDEKMVIWLGTTRNSRKVKQIENDPRVTLYYFDKDNAGYVSIIGSASLEDDQKMKTKWWKEEWEAFYPNRTDYLLIRVEPETLEVISEKHGITGDPRTWKPPVLRF